MAGQAIFTKKTILVLLMVSFIISRILFGLYIFPAMIYCPPGGECAPHANIEFLLVSLKVWGFTFIMLSILYYLYRKLGDQTVFTKKTVRILLVISLIISTILFYRYIHPAITYCPPDDLCEWRPKVIIVSLLITPLIITFIALSILYYLYRRLYRKN